MDQLDVELVFSTHQERESKFILMGIKEKFKWSILATIETVQLINGSDASLNRMHKDISNELMQVVMCCFKY